MWIGGVLYAQPGQAARFFRGTILKYTLNLSRGDCMLSTLEDEERRHEILEQWTLLVPVQQQKIPGGP